MLDCVRTASSFLILKNQNQYSRQSLRLGGECLHAVTILASIIVVKLPSYYYSNSNRVLDAITAALLNKHLPMRMREGRMCNRVSNHPSQKSIAESILWPKSVVAET